MVSSVGTDTQKLEESSTEMHLSAMKVSFQAWLKSDSMRGSERIDQADREAVSRFDLVLLIDWVQPEGFFHIIQ